MDRATSRRKIRLDMIRLLKHEQELTRQEIAGRLKISMPTALAAIEELLSRDVITEVGEQASTGGRRAKVFSLQKEGRYGIGIQITRKHVRFALTNLAGQVSDFQKITHPFADRPDWYRTLGARLLDFILAAGIDERKVIGAGLSFPGIIDHDSRMILHSHVFSLRNVSLDRFYKCIAFPLIIENDANCACFSEQIRDRETYFYLSLNESVGGAIMSGGRLHKGMRWKAGEAGHVLIRPGGKSCYCGKKGCADPYLNTGVLAGPEEDLDTFFSRLEAGDSESLACWEAYLEDLAILVSNLNMILDMDIVLGGDVGARMEPYMDRLSEITEKYDMFSRDVDYLSCCRCREHIFTVGAAMRAVEHFDERILDV